MISVFGRREKRARAAAVVSVASPLAAIFIRYLESKASIVDLRLLQFLILLPLAYGAFCGILALRLTRNWDVRRVAILGCVICIPYALMLLIVMLLGLR